MADKNLNMAFPFIFHKEEDGGYFIECADIDGVYTGKPFQNQAILKN